MNLSRCPTSRLFTSCFAKVYLMNLNELGWVSYRVTPGRFKALLQPPDVLLGQIQIFKRFKFLGKA